MRIDISFLPALALAFILIFSRIGVMVMLLPAIGESAMPARMRLTLALLLSAILLPLTAPNTWSIRRPMGRC